MTELEVIDLKWNEKEFVDRRGRRTPSILIGVGLRNDSEKDTIFVLGRLRQLNYDGATRTLALSTAEPEQVSEFVRDLPVVLPAVVAIPPSDSLEIDFSLPAEYVMVGSFKEEMVTTKTWSLRDARRIHVRIAFGRTAFRPVPGEASSRLRERVRKWSTVVEKSFDR